MTDGDVGNVMGMDGAYINIYLRVSACASHLCIWAFVGMIIWMGRVFVCDGWMDGHDS